jgi:hypothetical protein
MTDTVSDLIAQLDAETERIWLTEPSEIRALRLGVFPSGAGTHGQYFSNMVFVNGDMRALSSWITPAVILRAMDDDRFTLDQCKDLFAWTNMINADFLAYCGFVRYAELVHAIVGSFDDVASKDELVALLSAWYRYASRMYFWVHQVFPWSLGSAFPRPSQDDMEFMLKHSESTEVHDHFDRVGGTLAEFAQGADVAS